MFCSCWGIEIILWFLSLFQTLLLKQTMITTLIKKVYKLSWKKKFFEKSSEKINEWKIIYDQENDDRCKSSSCWQKSRNIFWSQSELKLNKNYKLENE